MPGLFSKIFRRKNGESEKAALVEQHTSGGRNGAKKKTNGKKTSPRGARKTSAVAGTSASAASSATTEIAANTAMSKTLVSSKASSSPTAKATTSATILHQTSGTKPGNEFAPSTTSTSKTSDRDSPTPVSGPEDAPDPLQPRSSPKPGRLQRPELSQGSRGVLSPRNSGTSPPSRVSTGPVDLDSESSDEEDNMMRRHVSSLPIFTMDGSGPAGPHLVMNKQPDDLNDDASSFNLSTDAEDTEYENFRRGVVPHSSLDLSVASTYKSDGEISVFPNLMDDDPLTPTEKGLAAAWDPNSPIHDFPTTSTTNTSPTTNASGFPSPPHQPASSARSRALRQKQSAVNATVTNTTNSSATAQQPFQDDFANFADFADFESQWPDPTSTNETTSNTGESSANKTSVSSPKKHSMVYIETGKLRKSSRGDNTASAASHSTRETSLTELLAQAKSKSTSRKSASSVNSAPVTSSYLVRDGGSVSRRLESRSTADGGGTAASVSDIIKNLDAADKTRDSSSIKSAKERLRKRRQQKESDESDEAAESWLFDEVTGALGPRGIAADLESLSGRSHQSGGGRSHKSHRSNKSKRRNRRSSGESVNSKDSKRSSASRRSRSSRYSHRSTKSYISQMSEQSRSVANDLLRLEMQLAMVGQQQSQQNQSNGGNDEPSKSSVGPEGHRSSRSRASSTSGRRTTSTSTARRSRISVMAPPGKLGIILANKADSKGTVVSGVRTSSVLAEKISPGDRIVAIDGEDVSLMTVSEITTIMARKADFERTLTVLTTPRTANNAAATATKGDSSQHQENGKKHRT